MSLNECTASVVSEPSPYHALFLDPYGLTLFRAPDPGTERANGKLSTRSEEYVGSHLTAAAQVSEAVNA